jgi:hypothetical protein
MAPQNQFFLFFIFSNKPLGDCAMIIDIVGAANSLLSQLQLIVASNADGPSTKFPFFSLSLRTSHHLASCGPPYKPHQHQT